MNSFNLAEYDIVPIHTRRPLLALAILFALTACGEAEPPAATTPAVPSAPAAEPAMPANHPPVASVDLFADAAAPAVVAENRGRVLAIHQAGGYSYVRVQQGGRNFWLAGPQMQAAVGETVQWGSAAVMRNFQSQALNRTFDEILFVSTLAKVSAVPVSAANRGRVVSLIESGGYSYVELDTARGVSWMAAQVAPVQVGDEVSWVGGTVMRNFTSSSLGRTFDEIIFVGTVSRMQ